MAPMPKRDPIKRVALLVDLESGATVALYAQPDPAHNDAEVDVQTRYPDPVEWFADVRPDERQPDVRWRVNGLHAYRAADNMPTMVRTYLDSIATAVDL